MGNKNLLLIFLFVLINSKLTAQNGNANTFESLTTELKNFKIDTSAVPDDKITKKITQLRNLKGGFNINEAIEFKITEEKEKASGDKSKEAIEKLRDYFTTGHGAALLNNAVIWIYRNEFTYTELKKLTKFYKTTAGQKLSSRFPVILLKSLAASEIITKTLK